MIEPSQRRARQRGAILLLTFLMMLVMAALATAIAVFAQVGMASGRAQLLVAQARYVAEAGWQRAREAIVAGDATCSGGCTESLGAGQYQVTVTGSGPYTITSDGYVPSAANPQARRRTVESSVPLNNTSTNQSLAATASASSSQGGNTPDKANDGNTGTRWRAETEGSNEWLTMDYGSLMTLDRIVILERDNIDGLTIELSSDASAWTTVPALSVVESPSKTWTATFASARKRYFRARFTSVPVGQRASVEEFQSFAPRLGLGARTSQW